MTEEAVQRGFEAVIHHGYSDFFPEPPEFEAVKRGWNELRPLIADLDLSKYSPFKPLAAFAPKSKINLRPVLLLHPVDLIIYSALVAELRDVVAAQRIPIDQGRVYSFRAENAGFSALYGSRPSHSAFEAEKLRRAMAESNGYVGFADIADFYPRLYQHKVRGALDSCVANDPRLNAYPAVIERFLRKLTHDGLSYGIPIGPAASRPLAEAALIDVDSTLLSFGIDFVRYIDDFAVFGKSREKVEWALRTLGEVLDKQHGLSLHAAKTRVVKCRNLILQASETVEDSVESRFAQLIEKRFYDENWRTLDDLEEDEKDALDAVDLEEVLEEALEAEEVDYKKVAFILERLSSLDRQDLIPIVLNHLPRLYAVAHAVHAFFRNAEPIDLATRKRCAEQLLAPILATADEQAPEFYGIWILDLFRLNPQWNEAASLARVFRETRSQSLKRYAALALSANGARAEAIPFKEAIHYAEPLTRSALLQASLKLGNDERRYWLQRLELSWFEKILIKHLN